MTDSKAITSDGSYMMFDIDYTSPQITTSQPKTMNKPSSDARHGRMMNMLCLQNMTAAKRAVRKRRLVAFSLLSRLPPSCPTCSPSLPFSAMTSRPDKDGICALSLGTYFSHCSNTNQLTSHISRRRLRQCPQRASTSSRAPAQEATPEWSGRAASAIRLFRYHGWNRHGRVSTGAGSQFDYELTIF